jgi:hypothetical protein
MKHFNRRRFLESSAGAAAVASLGVGSVVWTPLAHAQGANFKPEKGAKLRVLRWSRFVQGDIDAYMANVKRFIENPAARLGAAHLADITASGPPLPVLVRSLEVLRDLRLAANRNDIASRHADLERLRGMLGA